MIHLRRNQSVDLHRKKLGTAPELNLNKDADTFLKISLFLRCYSHTFTVANQSPGFSNSRLGNGRFFFKGKIYFSNVN